MKQGWSCGMAAQLSMLRFSGVYVPLRWSVLFWSDLALKQDVFLEWSCLLKRCSGINKRRKEKGHQWIIWKFQTVKSMEVLGYVAWSLHTWKSTPMWVAYLEADSWVGLFETKRTSVMKIKWSARDYMMRRSYGCERGLWVYLAGYPEKSNCELQVAAGITLIYNSHLARILGEFPVCRVVASTIGTEGSLVKLQRGSGGNKSCNIIFKSCINPARCQGGTKKVSQCLMLEAGRVIAEKWNFIGTSVLSTKMLAW